MMPLEPHRERAQAAQAEIDVVGPAHRPLKRTVFFRFGDGAALADDACRA